MFAIGAGLMLFILLAELASKGVVRKRWATTVASLGAVLMIASLLVLAWRWLP
jgi:hypothetical protein